MGERRAGDFARKKTTVLFYVWLVGAGRDAAANDDSEMISGLFHFGEFFFYFVATNGKQKIHYYYYRRERNVFIARTMVLFFL